MRRVFGSRKEKSRASNLEETSDKVNKRVDTIDEKIKKLELELCKYREQIKKTRPGPAQDAIKARALKLLKQKKMWVAGKKSKGTFCTVKPLTLIESHAQLRMATMKGGSKDLCGTLKTLKIHDIDEMQDNYTEENEESFGCVYSIPEDLDEEELMTELDALEADMGADLQVHELPSYLLPDKLL